MNFYIIIILHPLFIIYLLTGTRQFNPPAVARSGSGSAPQTPLGGQGQGQGSDPTSPSPSSSPAVLSGYKLIMTSIFLLLN